MSLLSDLNNKIKALSTRVGMEVKSLWESVNTAQSTAAAAQTAANTAQSTATAAQSTANTAKSTADTANSTANTANSTANTALSTANAKVSKSGDTMTGVLRVNSSGPAQIKVQHTVMDATTLPSVEQNLQIWFVDKNDVGVGVLQYIQYHNGYTNFFCTHRTTADGMWHSFGQQIDANNNPTQFFISAPKITFGNGTSIWIA